MVAVTSFPDVVQQGGDEERVRVTHVRPCIVRVAFVRGAAPGELGDGLQQMTIDGVAVIEVALRVRTHSGPCWEQCGQEPDEIHRFEDRRSEWRIVPGVFDDERV